MRCSRPSRTLSEGHGRLGVCGRHAEAQDYLRAKIKQWGSDEPSLYQMLAQSEERTGKPVQARRDLARYYVMTGAFAAAESQLQQARGMSSDFYEQSQIDVQINTQSAPIEQGIFQTVVTVTVTRPKASKVQAKFEVRH